MTLLLSDSSTWPAEVVDYLNRNRRLFVDWELSRMVDGKPSSDPERYDRAILGLRNVLREHALRGYHCSRLTDPEIRNIRSWGMSLPSKALLCSRIDAVEQAKLIEADIATRLKNENQANDSYRRGRLWFCFYPPRMAGQAGIERFFRSWGGEALYSSHERNPQTGKALRTIGIPIVIEADVPMASLPDHSCLGQKVVRRFLLDRGVNINEPVDHEDRALQSLPPPNIRRIIRFPEPDFIQLTGCDKWTPPLTELP
jgi:hypothetical protein